MLTAGCVSLSSRAAREKLPWRATAASVCRCASWMVKVEVKKYLIITIMTIDFPDGQAVSPDEIDEMIARLTTSLG